MSDRESQDPDPAAHPIANIFRSWSTRATNDVIENIRSKSQAGDFQTTDQMVTFAVSALGQELWRALVALAVQMDLANAHIATTCPYPEDEDAGRY